MPRARRRRLQRQRKKSGVKPRPPMRYVYAPPAAAREFLDELRRMSRDAVVQLPPGAEVKLIGFGKGMPRRARRKLQRVLARVACAKPVVSRATEGGA